MRLSTGARLGLGRARLQPCQKVSISIHAPMRREADRRRLVRSDHRIREKDSIYSGLRERIVEHAFVGDALRLLWQDGVVDVEVLRSEFDAHDYDLVMAQGRVVRHIQSKTGTSRS